MRCPEWEGSAMALRLPFEMSWDLQSQTFTDHAGAGQDRVSWSLRICYP
jgi:hypothetical protein